jgi:hypothetical protein
MQLCIRSKAKLGKHQINVDESIYHMITNTQNRSIENQLVNS